MDAYIKGYKYRIYPNQTQRILIAKTFGCCRVVYNHFLNVRQKAYEQNQESIGFSKTCTLLTILKKDKNFLWLNEVDSVALQQSLRDLDKAFDNFFKKRSGYPRFKSKHDNRQKYRTNNGNHETSIRIENGKLKLPKLGLVKIKLSRKFSGRILNATIERTPTGKYFVSLCVEQDIAPLMGLNNGGQVGIDVGIKEFYTDSNGNTVHNPKFLRKAQRKLAREQRRLSRKQKGSHNREKQRIRVARAHEKVTNRRRDFQHKESSKLVHENQVIAIEDLNIKGMLKNHKLARAISDVSWYSFMAMLVYKAFLYGTEVIKVPTFYPSSQTCSVCGYQNRDIKNLAIREWTCPKCGTHHDRDENAAINILNKALSIRESVA